MPSLPDTRLQPAGATQQPTGGLHPLYLRAKGFGGTTVPALEWDGRRVQGSLPGTARMDRRSRSTRTRRWSGKASPSRMDFQLINPAGVTLSKAEYLAGIESGQLDYRAWEAGEISVRLY